MKLLLFILALLTLLSIDSCTESQATKVPELHNCSLIANTDFWAMYEVKTKEGDYIIVDGETGIVVLKK